MDSGVKKILTALYELEGLIRVARVRDVSERDALYEIIREKAQFINDNVNAAFAADLLDEAVNDNTDEYDFVPESFDFVGGQTDEPVQSRVDDVALIDDITESLPEPEIVTDNVADTDEVDEQYEEVEETEEADDDFEADNDDDDEYVDDEEESASDIATDDDDDEAPDSQLRVDEILGRTLSRNLKKAFTLNDRFRFRRELFGNSEVEFNETLNLVEAMHSYEEAEDYFYNDMQWDKESPEVVDFMTIIKKHFAQI